MPSPEPDALRNRMTLARVAAAATIAGWFYAKAYLEGKGIRAAMVTHALTNVVARVFLAA